jgi:hypothetical protein
MTQQYVAGELSLRLGQLDMVATDQERSGEVARLRHEVETTPLATLGSVAVRALGLADALCWDSLTRGDTTSFAHQAVICVELHEFGVCAGLLGEG